jgi:signal transduction histidine kinase
MAPTIAAKGLEVVIACDASPEQILTDPLRLHQIIANLLTHALRSTEVGSIRITAQTLPEERWSIAITDTGVGIAPEQQARIFEPQFQMETSHQGRDFDSRGLGLAIVSRLVTLLHGEITVTSIVGTGSTFTVHFPITVPVSDTESSLSA